LLYNRFVNDVSFESTDDHLLFVEATQLHLQSVIGLMRLYVTWF